MEQGLGASGQLSVTEDGDLMPTGDGMWVRTAADGGALLLLGCDRGRATRGCMLLLQIGLVSLLGLWSVHRTEHKTSSLLLASNYFTLLNNPSLDAWDY